MNDTSRDHWSAFVDAAHADRDLADEMLRKNPSLLEMPGVHDETPLHFLALEAFSDGTRYLIAKGANVNCVNEFGHSVLQEVTSIAHRLASTEFVSLLLDAGSDPYHFSNTNACAWHTATSSGYPPLKELFQRLPPPSSMHDVCELLS